MSLLLLFAGASSGVTPPVVVVPTITGAGFGRERVARKRYILPDGKTLFATMPEIDALLREFTVTKTKNRYAPTPRAEKPAITSALEMAEMVKFQPLKDEPDTIRVRLSPKVEWRAKPEDLQAALAAFGMMQSEDDEEAAIVLLLN